MERSKRNMKSLNRGITLIALVITIIVLLILAGVSIAMLTGDNGILTQAKDAKIQTEIGKAEELANLAHADLLTDHYNKGTPKPTLADIKSELEKEGYTVKQIATGEGSITGIELSQESVSMAPGESKEITVSYTGQEGGNYYVEIEGNYYEMTLENGVVSIAKEKTEIDGGAEENLKATSDNSKIEVTVKGTTITIKDKGNESTTAKITVTYGEYSKICTVAVVKKPTDSSEQVEGVTFSTKYGKIDVIWLDTNNNVISKPNVPELTSNGESLIPIKWDEGNNIVSTTADDSNWYNYEEHKWANAKTKNESLFVWIPRYAYRITYYENETSDKVTGYYDGYGQWSAETGEIRVAMDSGIEKVDYNGEKYIVHPAFETNLENGGWDKDLAGMWVAKFEANGTGPNLKFTYGVSSTRSQKIGTQYTSARQATYGYTGQQGEDGNTSFMNSHMMKNSEWGAVAYLTHSKYGLNGKEITINNNGTTYYTGGGTGEAYKTNINQSSTGNVYGIYDLSGNAWEYAAAFNSVDTNGYFSRNGWTTATGLTTDSASTKYATKYDNTESSSGGNQITCTVGKVGDATKEVNTGGSTDISNTSTKNNWFSDYPYLVNSSYPFFLRGGNYYGGSGAGVFCSHDNTGDSCSDGSFRAALGG